MKSLEMAINLRTLIYRYSTLNNWISVVNNPLQYLQYLINFGKPKLVKRQSKDTFGEEKNNVECGIYYTSTAG